jgi:hypothetical protein
VPRFCVAVTWGCDRRSADLQLRVCALCRADSVHPAGQTCERIKSIAFRGIGKRGNRRAVRFRTSSFGHGQAFHARVSPVLTRRLAVRRIIRSRLGLSSGELCAGCRMSGIWSSHPSLKLIANRGCHSERTGVPNVFQFRAPQRAVFALWGGARGW